MISRTFKAPAARRPDTHRKVREAAKALAKEHNIEIEPIDSGFNVWPPRGFAGPDPYEDDHYAQDWSQALEMVQAYAK
jgi:hypothetical protein